MKGLLSTKSFTLSSLGSKTLIIMKYVNIAIFTSIVHAMGTVGYSAIINHSDELLNHVKSSIKSYNFGGRRGGSCSRPCQRVVNMVKLAPILGRHGVNKNVIGLIEAENSNSYGEIDIGKCIGSCRGVGAELIRVS